MLLYPSPLGLEAYQCVGTAPYGLHLLAVPTISQS